MNKLCLLAILGSAVSADAASESSKIVTAISEQYWQKMLQDPGQRLQQGLPVNALPDVSYRRAASEAGQARAMLGWLRAVNPSQISHEEEITVDELRWQLNLDVASEKYFWLKPAVTPYQSQIPLANRIFTTWQFRTTADADRYLDLLTKYEGFIRSVQGILATQLARKIVLPGAEIMLVDPFLASYIKQPEKSLFYVSTERLASLSPAASDRFRTELVRIIQTNVNPSLEELLTFLRGTYLANAPEAVGESQYPGGKEYYRFLVRRYTTMDVTPEQVYQTGIEEVKRLNDRMAEIRTNLGFQGSKAEFHEALKKDLRFYAKTPEEVQARLMAFVHQMEPKIDANFRIAESAVRGQAARSGA